MGHRVKQILEDTFTGIQVDLADLPGQRITGSVVWEGFTGHDHVERQQQVRKALQAALGSEVQQVGILLTYTPNEYEQMMAA